MQIESHIIAIGLIRRASQLKTHKRATHSARSLIDNQYLMDVLVVIEILFIQCHCSSKRSRNVVWHNIVYRKISVSKQTVTHAAHNTNTFSVRNACTCGIFLGEAILMLKANRECNGAWRITITTRIVYSDICAPFDASQNTHTKPDRWQRSCD